MNFDAQIGDTIRFEFMFYHLKKDTVFSARFVVKDITTNDHNLKTFITNVLHEDVLIFWDLPVPRAIYQEYSYTEKIGIEIEFMPIFKSSPEPLAIQHRRLRCYSDADFSIILDWWNVLSLPCDHFTP